MVPTLIDSAQTSATPYLYARLYVVDGARKLEPRQISPDSLLFREPPQLAASSVEVIITNGDEEQRHWATVLPHDPDATEIPVKMAPPHFLKPNPPQL